MTTKVFLKLLDNLHIRNLSIFFPDPIYYSSCFRIPFSRIFKLINMFNWNSASWINSTRFCLDSVYGKVRREDIAEYEPGSGYVIFEREGHRIKVPDLPESMDDPGDIKILLWKAQT